jgi:hypothetical protein
MNEHIKKLADQVWLEFNDNGVARCDATDLERFAELVRADEREACAKLCEIYSMAGNLAGLCATAIRARGNE